MNDIATKQTNPKALAVMKRKDDIQAMEADLKKMLPQSVPSDKFIRTVQTAITMNPDIAECDKNSVIGACMKAASDGLVLDGREAAITIYNTKQKDGSWKKTAQYIPMVAGVIKRVRNSGEVSRLNAFVVYRNDTFHVSYGLEMRLEHVPNFENPGDPIGAYAICLFKDGENDFEFMSVKQINDIKARSKSGEHGPWKTDWSEMARKTAIRRLAKRLPVDSDIARVVERIDEDYDLKPAREDGYQVTDDGEIIEQAQKPAPAKARGSAAAKLNPKPAEEEQVTIDQPQETILDPAEPEMPAHFDDGFEDVM